MAKTVSGSEVRVHSIAAKFVLRQGDEVLCLFNEAYVPEGLATGTMTTSPAVERLTRDHLIPATTPQAFAAGSAAQPQK